MGASQSQQLHMRNTRRLDMSAKERSLFLVALLMYQIIPGKGFIGQSAPFLRPTKCINYRSLNIVNDQRWSREIEDNSRKKAQGGGMGETVAGALLGSLVLGPFGKSCIYRS